MKHRAGKILLAAGASLLLLTGCGKEPSAVDIMKETVKDTNRAESFSGEIAMTAGIGMQESGVSLGLDMNIDMDVEAIKKTGACHMKGSVSTGLTDEQMNLEVYNLPEEEDGSFVTYLNVADTWTKTKSDNLDEEKNIASLMNLESYIKNGSKLELEKDTEKEEGREVYVITTSADGSGLGSAGMMLDSLFGDSEELGNSLNLPDVGIKVTFKIYKDELLPASVSMTFSGKDGEELVIPDNTGRELCLKEISFTLSFREFDTIEKIEAPAEATMDARSDSMDIMGELEKDDSEKEESQEACDIREYPESKDAYAVGEDVIRELFDGIKD